MPVTCERPCQPVTPRHPALIECDIYHSQTLPSGEVMGNGICGNRLPFIKEKLNFLAVARSPFTILDSLAQRIGQTIVIVEPYKDALGEEAICRFMPYLGVNQVDTWWQFSPQFFASSLGLLGFPGIQVISHPQKCEQLDDLMPMFTVVASRQISEAA